MKTERAVGIFSFILLLAVLSGVVGSRARLKADVVIDGGAQTAAAQTDEDSAKIAAALPAAAAEPTEPLPKVNADDWELILVNKDNTIKSTPEVAEIGKTGAYFDKRAVSALNSFISACRAAGYSPYINLAYVPYSAQEYYFNNKAAEMAGTGKVTEADLEKASRVVARPGQSEHQTGLAVDITDDYSVPYTNEKIDPDMLKWLVEHCAEYGFIRRYPAGKENITGYMESYHFRYVGKAAAEYIMDHDLCLEEFLALYK